MTESVESHGGGAPLATTPLLRGLIAALPFVLAAGLALLFDAVREIPIALACNESEPPGYDALVTAYQSGAVPLHFGVIACALGAIALLSVGPETGPLGIRPSTLAALVFAAFTVLVIVTGGSEARHLLVPLYAIAIGLAELAAPFGPQRTAILAMLLLLLLLGATFVFARVVAGRPAGPRVALWILVLLTGGHLLLVDLQGEAPFFC